MNPNEEVTVLGIDISKAKFDVALRKGKNKIKTKVFANTPEGFAELQAWLNSQGVTNLQACMEATSIYRNALARFLFAAGYKVSIVNPSRPKAFGRSELSRTKTDRADAKVIARFCAVYSSGRMPTLFSIYLLTFKTVSTNNQIFR
jgi:transposase